MKNEWSKEETIIAFNVYCKIPFKNSSKTHPLVVQYANLLGRSPSALNMKIGNLGRLDPNLKEKGIVGLGHGSKMEEIVWEEFANNPEKLSYESELLIARFLNKTIEETSGIDLNNIPEGIEKTAIVKQRVNQSFFRNTVLASYNFCCCISGVKETGLLDACHIIEWAEDKRNRLNPTNGLCMNPFFHRAYDKNLIAITPDYKIKISNRLINQVVNDDFKGYLNSLNNGSIIMPDRFLPNKNFLELRYENFKKSNG